MEPTEISSVFGQFYAHCFALILHRTTYHAVLFYCECFIERHVRTHGRSISNVEQIGQEIEVVLCAWEADDVPKMLHTWGSATSVEAENPLNARKGSDEHTRTETA